MGDSPPTRLSLLVRLRDSQDDVAWAEFVEVYAPLIHGFACKQGLQDADAADLTQEVLRSVARGIKRLDYDPERGRLFAARGLYAQSACRGSHQEAGRPVPTR